VFCERGGVKQGKKPFILILKRNLRNLQLVQRWQKIVQSTLIVLSLVTPTYLIADINPYTRWFKYDRD
jgi:hypothetical protein